MNSIEEEIKRDEKKKFTRFLHLKYQKIFNSPIVWIILSYLNFSFSLHSLFFKEFFFVSRNCFFLSLSLNSLPKYTMLLCALPLSFMLRC